MATPESKVKQQVKTILNDLGAYYFMPATGGYGRSGVPDFVGCYLGRFFALECKANGGTTTTLQQREIKRIIDAGGYASVVDEQAVPTLKQLMRNSIV
jgi:Holliday junction resolvase